jgi:SAM-dependent methyltransferase
MRQYMTYDFPQYYEIAFSFRDIPRETEIMDECVRRYSTRPTKRFLELACGPCPHMVELSKRGFHYSGIDISEPMLEFARRKAAAAGIDALLFHASMIDFEVEQKADFVFVALGSLYAKSTSELNLHFDSVAGAMQPGGLYLMDWCVQFSLDKIFLDAGDTWECARDGVRVTTTVRMRPVDFVEQVFEENVIMDVEDNGEKKLLSSAHLKRVIFPQEFLSFIRQRPDFEFVGWWNNWDLSQPLSSHAQEITRPIVLLKRT